jgi:hypothetical protein
MTAKLGMRFMSLLLAGFARNIFGVSAKAVDVRQLARRTEGIIIRQSPIVALD